MFTNINVRGFCVAIEWVAVIVRTFHLPLRTIKSTRILDANLDK
jgi:hypothetical protein